MLVGAVPHLLQLLWQEFLAAQAKEATEKSGGFGKSSLLTPAPVFLEWATQYLNTNRVVENFPADANHGIRLSNTKLCLICPATEPALAGSMQNSGAVPVAEGKSQPGLHGVSSTEALRV